MSKPLVTNALWALVSLHLLPWRPKPKGGRPPLENSKALTGILFVLLSGIPWKMLLQEIGCGSVMTCWRRLRDWQAAGSVGEGLPGRLGKANAIRLEPGRGGCGILPGKKGAPTPSPTRPIVPKR